MIKLKGSLFNNAMDFNEISLKDGIVKIHNSTGDGFGRISQYKTSESGELQCIINKKDYNLLHTFDEINIELVENVLKVKAPGFSAKIANIVGKILIEPDTTDMVDTSVSYRDIYRGKDFAGTNDTTKIMLEGSTILKNKILISNGLCVYSCDVNNVGKNINIPKEVFKLIDSSLDYKIMTNGKMAIFLQKGHAIYTSLIEVLIPDIEIPDDIDVIFKVKKSIMVEKLKLLKPYNNIIEITIIDNEMILKAESEGNELELAIEITPVKLSKVHVAYSVDSILKLLSILDEDEATMNLTFGNMLVVNGNATAIAMRNTCNDMEVVG